MRTLLNFFFVFSFVSLSAQELPLDFETNYAWMEFGGGVVSTVNNPFSDEINNSTKVGKMVKYSGETWGGSFLVLQSKVDLTNNDIIIMKAYSIKSGTKVLFKLEKSSSNDFVEREVTMTAVSEWESLVFDFTGVADINYDKITLIFDSGIQGNGSSNFTYYFDDINYAEGGSSEEDVQVLFNFDDVNPNSIFYSWDNDSQFQKVSNPFPDDVNNSSKVAKFTHGNNNWSPLGAVFVPNTPINFQTHPIVLIKVWSDKEIEVTCKLEKDPWNETFVERKYTLSSTQTNSWTQLRFDFTGESVSTINKINLYLDGEKTFSSQGSVYYFDDIVKSYDDTISNNPCVGGATGNLALSTDYTLVWADEFNDDGAPCHENWTYDLGTGNNGWGNWEAQSYTRSANNVVIEDGTLKVIALKNGDSYTSSRLKSINLFDFTYGRVEVRAKLPATAGTWPAVWLLGSNVNEVSWPECGEIDIIEQFSDKNINMSTAHWDNNGNNASYGEDVYNSSLTSEFHTYRLDWTTTSLKAYLDGAAYWTMGTGTSMPFNLDFHLIINLALGGDKGAGPIDPNFTSDVLEIDWIRVYQNQTGSNSLDLNEWNQSELVYYAYPIQNSWSISSTTDRIEEVRMFSISGQEVFQSKPLSNQVKIQSFNLSKGVYLTQIKTTRGLQTLRLIK